MMARSRGESASHDALSPRRLGLAAAALAALPYLLTLRHALVWDDVLHIAANSRLAWPDVLSYFGRLEGLYWRPLVFATYAIDHALWGGAATGFHLTNLLLHAANAGLLAIAACNSGLGGMGALAAAVLFAWHPLQVDAVAYVSGRTDLLVCAGALLAWSAVSGTRSAAARGVIAAAACAVAMLSKESGFALLGLVPWWAWQRGRGRAERWWLAAPTLVVGFGLLALRPGGLPASALAGGDACARAAGMGRALWAYLGLVFWPAELQVDRLTPLPDDARLAVTLLLITAAVVIWAMRCGRPVAQWVLWSAAFYLPVSNALVLYPAIAGRALFTPEHNLYTPLAGLAVLAALAGERLASRRRWIPGVAAVALLSCGLRAAVRVQDWRDEERLFRAAAAAGSTSPRVWYNLGNTLLRKGENGAAADAYESAVRLAPGDPQSWANLAVARQQQGALDAALTGYQRALMLAPNDAQLRENLGTLYLARRDLPAARRELEEALRLDPTRPTARRALQALAALRAP